MTDPSREAAALVGGEPVTVAEVDAELGRLRAGPLGARLPPDGTAEGRQLRRWTAQRVVLRRLLEREAATRRRTETGALQPALQPVPPPRPDPALLGGAAADVLTTSAAARAVYAAVTVAESVSEAETRDHYDRNLDRYTRPPRWLVRQATGADRSTLDALLAAAEPVPVDPTGLPAEVRQALADQPPGTVVGPVRSPLGWHLATVDEMRPGGPVPYPEVRDRIAADLLARRRQRAFGRWLDRRVAVLVRLRPGYEHPADPGNPDATHRH